MGKRKRKCSPTCPWCVGNRLHKHDRRAPIEFNLDDVNAQDVSEHARGAAAVALMQLVHQRTIIKGGK